MNKVWWKLAIEVVGVFSVAALAAAQLDWPSQGFWDDSEWVVTVALGGALFQALFGIGDRILVERAEVRRHRLRDRLRTPLSALVVAVAGSHDDIDATHVGASVWRIARARKLGLPFGQQHLERLQRVRLSAVPPPSGLTWTEGVGVVGTCWKERRPIVGDFSGLRDITESRWKALGEARRFGLTHAQFRKVAEYETVATAPIISRNERIIGVVSLDIVHGADGKRDVEAEWLEETVQTSADQIAAYLSDT